MTTVITAKSASIPISKILGGPIVRAGNLSGILAEVKCVISPNFGFAPNANCSVVRVGYSYLGNQFGSAGYPRINNKNLLESIAIISLL
jgi:hypothetical protein